MFVLQNYGGLLYLMDNYLWMSFICILCIIENGISYKLKRVCNIILYYIVFNIGLTKLKKIPILHFNCILVIN